MIIGCLVPFVLMLAGAVTGHLLGRAALGLWGAVIGVVAGFVLAAVLLTVLERKTRI